MLLKTYVVSNLLNTGVALKHHTSKLASFEDLSTVRSFGFRGEALSSLCALSETVIVTTATAAPMGVSLEMDRSGRVKKKSRVARQVSLALYSYFAPCSSLLSVEHLF